MRATTPSRIYVLFSLPKSGAQAFAAALDAGFIPSPFGKHYPPSMTVPNGLHVEIPVNRGLATDFPVGGWLHTHAPVTFATVDALAAMRMRYVVMIRNPLDQLAAFYCHVVKHLDLIAPVPGHPDLIYSVPMARLRRDVFADENALDVAFTHLIHDGYLEACLRWIADWLSFRDRRRSRVVRYEDFVERPAQTLLETQALLNNCIAFDDERLAGALDALAAYRKDSYEARADRDTFYPRGWTGAVGVRSRYLTPEQESEAVGIVERFVRTYAHGHLVAEAYPEFLSAQDRIVA
jgi:Sulfotransferase domain